jgi:prepilin-type N-terminal cleavage/methylation domain-containing protein
MKKNFKKLEIQFFFQKGFSLLEVMVAIFILIMGLSSVLVLTTKSISGASRSTSRLIAANLAQEGIEVVKNIRDYNFNGSDPDGVWTAWHATGYSNGCTLIAANQYNCSVQYNSTTFGIDYNAYLRFQPEGSNPYGRYSYTSGTDTPFRRKIILEKINNAQLRVNSVVTWVERGVTLSVDVEDRLWNWR